MHIRLKLMLFVGVVCSAAAAQLAGQQTMATFIYPVNGQQNVNTSTPFQWTSVPGGLGYYLWVGTSAGTSNLVNSGALQTSSYKVSGLPANQTLYARVWTQTSVGSVLYWVVYQDITFTSAQANATFIYPVNGQQNVGTSATFQWTTVPGGLGYYLWVGTSAGTSNLVNSGALQTASYKVSGLPANQTLYARIWTQTSVGSVLYWMIYQDVTFTTAPAPATFIYPLNGQQSVSTSTPFQWTAVPGGLGYQLYVGTAAGASNLVNSGTLQTTSYQVPALPTNQTLYARIWTQTSAGWTLYQDITFTAAQANATFIYPVNGQQSVGASTTFQWTTVPGGLGYYLWVGTSAGTSNLVNSGTLQTTSYRVSGLPANQTLYARIWTQTSIGSVLYWVVYQDVTFTTAPVPATFIYPLNGQQNVSTNIPFQWTSAPGALGYQLYVGTSLGASNLVNSGALPTTYYQVPALPANQTLYARIWTETSAGWQLYQDIVFTCAPLPQFLYPVPQSPQINPTAVFQWVPAATFKGIAPLYHLTIGTSPAASNLFASGPLSQNSYTAPSSALPIGSILYARVIADLGDGSHWRTDTVFTVAGTPITPAQMIYPLAGQANVDVSNPFQWTPTDLAQAYDLKLSFNGSVVQDSGPIRVPRYFAENLPLGAYTGQLGTEIANQWYWVSFQFTIVHTGAIMATEITHALWATDFVRTMADQQNYPYAWTNLWNLIAGVWTQADCGYYRNELLIVLSQMNIAARLPASLQPQVLDLYFAFETHTLVQFYNTDSGSWMLLDPTFDLTVKKTSGGWASAQDMQTATLNKSWSSITYQFLGAYGNSLATGYYMDYPLLYLNIGQLTTPPSGNNPLPYLQFRPMPTAAYGAYLIQSPQNPVILVVDGQTRSISTGGIQSLSPMFLATSISLPTGSTASVNVYVPNWYVF